MDEQLHEIDKLFKKAVEMHEDAASGKVWENLEKNLQKRNATSINKKYIKWKTVAAALFIFSVALAMYTVSLMVKGKKAGEIRPGISNISAAEDLPLNKAIESRGGANDEVTDTKVYKSISGMSHDRGIVKDEYSVEKKETDATSNKMSANETAGTITGQELSNEKKLSDKKDAQITKAAHTASSSAKANIATIDEKSKSFLQQSSNQESRNAKERRAFRDDIKRYTVTNDPDKKASKVASSVAGADEKEETKVSTYSNSASTINRHIDRSIAVSKLPDNVALNLPLTTALISSITGGTSQTKGYRKSNIASVRGTINRGNYTIGIFYSQGSVYNNIKPNNPDFREDNYQQIKSSQKNIVSTIVGLSIERNIGRNFGIESGVSLQTLRADISAKPLVARRDNNGKINYRLSTSLGYAYYTVKNRQNPAMADTIHSLSSNARVRYISVPIGVQYHFYLGKRITFNPAVVFFANFLANAEATTNQSLEHTYSGSLEGLKSTYFDARLRSEIGYYFTKKIGISLTPTFTFGLSDATEANPVSTRRHSVGMAAGLDFKF